MRESGRRTPFRLGFIAGSLTLLAVLLLRGLTACSGTVEPAVQIQDSAGVEVVENLRPVWRQGESWTVGEEPLLRLGVVDGDPVFQFSGITGVTRLGDGTVVVADDGSQEVRFFDSAGRATAVVGGRGGGPEEFTGLAGLGWNPSGGVWAYDFSLRRIAWISPEGRIVGLTSLPSEPPVLNAVGALPDGTFILKQLWGYSAVAGARDPGLRRDPVALVKFGREATVADTLALYPGREVYLFEEDGRGVMSTPPFARNATATIRKDRVVVGTQEVFSLQEVDEDGSLRRIVRIPDAVSPVGDADLEAYIQGRLATAPPDRHPSIRRALEEMPRPETLPAYGGILGDRAGNLWVESWAMAPETADRWTVFDEAGRWLGQVILPERFHPWDIGEDWMVGTERDELDVEYVVLYEIIKD